MKKWSRRSLIQAAGAASLGAAFPLQAGDELVKDAPEMVATPPADPWRGLKVGVASYSLRGMKLEAVIAGIQRVDLKYVSIKDIHLPLPSTPDERKAVAAQFREAGITPLSCGVVTMENDEANVRAAFEYARDIGVGVIVCSPHPDSFAILDRMVKEFGIRLAIHNHGPESDRFKSPYDALKAAEKFDERIGLCIDVGHTARSGVDPAKAIRECRHRLFDVHLKDIFETGRRNAEIELGRGILDVQEMLSALLEINYSYHVGIEHEKDARDPMPGLAESVGYARGIMRCIGSK